MTFGLGYFQDGVWVDHRAGDRGSVRDPADPIDAIHEWFSCCADPADVECFAEDRDSPGPAMGIALQAVAGTATR